MGLFGPSKEEVWRQLSEEINIDLVDGGFWKGSHVEGRHENWVTYLDTYTVSSGQTHTHTTYTRIRAPFVNKKGFQFKIYQSGFFSDIGKVLGMQDIEVGYEPFDSMYVIQSNDVGVVTKLFSNHNIRSLIELQPRLKLETRNSEGIFGPSFNQDESELYFSVVGIIKDIELLKALFDLFSAVLIELEVMGCATGEKPGVKLY